MASVCGAKNWRGEETKWEGMLSFQSRSATEAEGVSESLVTNFVAMLSGDSILLLLAR